MNFVSEGFLSFYFVFIYHSFCINCFAKNELKRLNVPKHEDNGPIVQFGKQTVTTLKENFSNKNNM